MSWLKDLEERVANLPADRFKDRSGGLNDVRRVVALAEKFIEDNEQETVDAGNAALLAAVQNPFRDHAEGRVFEVFGSAIRKASVTFPRVLRRSLLMAVYSHAEYMLRGSCESLSESLQIPRSFTSKRKGEQQWHRYLRYMRDEATMPLGDFTAWPEWPALDGYRRVRNCLAHNGGIVSTSEDAERIRSLPGIEVDDSGLELRDPVIHLLPNACDAALDTLLSFFERLIQIAESAESQEPVATSE